MSKDLYKQLKCATDTMAWSKFECEYFGFQSHMHFESKLYSPENEFNMYTSNVVDNLRQA